LLKIQTLKFFFLLASFIFALVEINENKMIKSFFKTLIFLAVVLYAVAARAPSKNQQGARNLKDAEAIEADIAARFSADVTFGQLQVGPCYSFSTIDPNRNRALLRMFRSLKPCITTSTRKPWWLQG